MATYYEERYSYHPEDFKQYGTERIRSEFLVSNIFDPGNVRMVYSLAERYIVGGALPVNKSLPLETIDPLKSEYFCERREVGIMNVGGAGKVLVDGVEYGLDYKDALYVGRGSKEVLFVSNDAKKPARFYFNSAPAHKEYPAKHVTLAQANVLHMGSAEASNKRDINQLMINTVVDTCQLQMGMTELKPGSVWNTMPAHTHSRRNEVYFYFEVPDDQAVCHFMGQPEETRHIWLKNEEAVISPSWSIHSAAGTSNYIFIWGMAGENLDYTDMDIVQPTQLK
ncbi:MAG: 5-dehydro-4-deoxy-D-glucuronate isomerase [Prolixibacteraceae bacterium]|jgi:4-deoxy-L-threo-5-hexosulose-uronate ketol-isomerase|nr:5-dehydro-4-deoxy-D-glucuronate isomerase [Prolixibacteraceae bacterium]